MTPLTSRPWTGAGLIVLASWVVGVTTASMTFAQTAPRFSWQGVPLEAAIEEFVAETDIDLGYDPALVSGKKAYCETWNKSPEIVLRCLLHGTGLFFQRLPTGTYVLTSSSRAPDAWGMLEGRVVDAETGTPLPNAHILLTRFDFGQASDEAGTFAFTRLSPGPYLVTATYLGYKSATTVVEVPPGEAARVDLALQAEPILYTPIVIDGMKARTASRRLGLAEVQQPSDRSLPSSGASNPLGDLDAMMGVRVNDATSDVHVQGGGAGEHQFLLDGAPVFIPLNVISFIGPFSPFALERITVHKAGFDASLGSQIAGVIETEHALPSRGPRQIDVQVDPLSMNARVGLLRRSASGRESSLMITGRRGLWDVYAPASLRALLRDWNTIDTFLLTAFAANNTPFEHFESLGSPGVGFNDLHVAGEVKFDPRHTLHGSVFWGQTRLGNTFPQDSLLLSTIRILPDLNARDSLVTSALSSVSDRYTWQNGVAQTHYTAVLGPSTVGSMQVRGSYYRLSHTFNTPDSVVVTAPEDDGNRILEIATSGRLDHSFHDRQYLLLGADAIFTSSRFTLAGAQVPIRHRFSGWRMAGFAEHRLLLGDHVTFEAGSRFTYLRSRRQVYAEPRFSVRLDWPETPVGAWSVFLGTGIYQQFVNQFDVSSRSPRTFVSSTRFWMATDSTVAPPQALHYAGELLYQPTPGWALSLEGYYKRQRHIVAIDYATVPASAGQNLRQNDFLKSSWGYAYGGAIQLSRKIGSWRLLGRYEYSEGKRGIFDLFQDRLHRVPWIEPHRLEFRLDARPLPGVTLLARWRSIWGRTWGFRQSYYDFVGAHLRDLDQLASGDLIRELAQTGINLDALTRVGRQVQHFGLDQPNNHTLPALVQLDLSLAYTIHLGTSTVQARIDLLNMLDRRNVAERRLVFDENTYFDPGSDDYLLLKEEDRQLLPRVTSFALKLNW